MSRDESPETQKRHYFLLRNDNLQFELFIPLLSQG